MLREHLISVGRELYERGLQTTRSGNISARDGDRFIITRTGTNLGRLTESDLIEVPVDAKTPIPGGASCETPVHRAIYNASSAMAVVHAHPPYAIGLAQATVEDGLRPCHNEAIVGLGWIPIVNTTVRGQEGGEIPDGIAAELAKHRSVIVRGHGAFSVGHGPEEALYRMLLLEDCCKINFIHQVAALAKSSR